MKHLLSCLMILLAAQLGLNAQSAKEYKPVIKSFGTLMDLEKGKTLTEFSDYLIKNKFQDVNLLIKQEDGLFAWFIIQLSPNTIIKYTKNEEWHQDDESSYSIYYKKDDEANAKRVLKAIMHLAKLSGAKENKQIFNFQK